MSGTGVLSVQSYTAAFEKLLTTANRVKRTPDIEPALTAGDFDGQIEEAESLGSTLKANSKQAQYASIETAFRNIFYDLLAGAPAHHLIYRSNTL